MHAYVYQFLRFFRNIFSRQSTWLVFCMVILGFIGSGEMVGVTSFCRFWSVEESGYHSFLNFFRSSAWSLETLICYWSSFVLSQKETVFVHGRAVILGDHTNVSKEGRRMPCVVSLHQHSETQSKPSYFRGHCWGAIGLMIGSMVSPYCLPLALGIHQGLVHIGKKNPDEADRETLGSRIVQMALDFAVQHDLPSILILDAFFPWGRCFHTGQFPMVTEA